MRWSKVNVEAIAFELPTESITSAQLDARLGPIHEALKISPGQLEALTGIRERRQWPPNTTMSSVAARAGKKALERAGVSVDDVGAVIYAGVCRDNLEPATACAVAAELGTGPETLVFDVSNACLGVLNGMVELANRIELGQLRAGLVVSAESSREIVDALIHEGKDVSYAEIDAPQGHDSFLLAIPRYTDVFGAYMKRIQTGGHHAA